MIFKRSIVFCFLLSIFFCSAQGQQKVSGVQFNHDVSQLSELLKKYYPGLYYYESEGTFDYRLNLLKRSPDDSLSILDAYKLLAGFVSNTQDLHLSMGLPKKFFNKNSRVLPFILKRFDNDFYVHYNQSQDTTIVRGSKILSIDSISIIADFNNLKTLYGADFENPYSKNYYAEVAFSSFYNRWYGQKDSVSVTYQISPDSSVKSTYVKLITQEEAVKITSDRYKNVFRKNFDLTVLDSASHTYKLDITSFKTKGRIPGFRQNIFKRELKKSFKKIDADSVNNLVLDLRGNGGGAIVNIHRLLSYLSPEPFKIYDTLYIKETSFNKLSPLVPGFIPKIFFKKGENNIYYESFLKKKFKPKAKYHFEGKLYVLMNGGSYSATSFTIGLLKNMNRAVFVGTPPGGANWGSFAGMFYNAKLSETKLRVNIPLMKIIHSTDGLKHNDFFVQPDFYVNQNFNDFLVRRDTQVEFIKKLVK